ncbi:MAG: hypothetical protein JO101_08075 [Candidatus Eremiobacteraeota bacterium]|nr:hypothetical protein [Candidatus Eremiobacteraeota bacterium]
MTKTETLWLRALKAVDARGVLPSSTATLTPGEIASEVARRGDDRLARIVAGWYYPASYGRERGTLTDDEVDKIVSTLEAENSLARAVEEATNPPLAEPAPAELPKPAPRLSSCELCGFPIIEDR